MSLTTSSVQSTCVHLNANKLTEPFRSLGTQQTLTPQDKEALYSLIKADDAIALNNFLTYFTQNDPRLEDTLVEKIERKEKNSQNTRCEMRDLKMTALQYAASLNKINAVRCVLEKMVNPNTAYGGMMTPLCFAVIHENAQMMALLLKYQANPNGENTQKITPLYLAVSQNYKDGINILLKNNANPNHQNQQGWTPLHCAVKGNQVEVTRILVEAGKANLSIKTSQGQTLLDLAKEKGYQIIHDYLVVKGIKQETSTHASIGNAEVFQLAQSNAYHKTLTSDEDFHTAVIDGDFKTATRLIQQGANIDSVDQDGCSALHRAVDLNNIRAVQFLVDSGADLFLKNLQNNSPLFLSISLGHHEISNYLLQKELSIYKTNSVSHREDSFAEASYCKPNLHISSGYLLNTSIAIQNHIAQNV